MLFSLICRLHILRTFAKSKYLKHELRLKHSHVGIIKDAHPYARERLLNLNRQSVLLPGPERIRASPLVDDPTRVVDKVPFENIRTVYDVLDCGRRVTNDGDCLGVRSGTAGVYKWIKYSEAILRSQFVGSALIHLGHEPKKNTLVGIIASNKIEYSLFLWGCAGYSLVLVPIYESFGIENVCKLINEAGLKLIVANNSKNTLNILKNAKKFPSLKTVVSADPISPEIQSLAEGSGIKLLSFTEFEDIGKRHKRDPILPDPDDLLCITYTSGTTGVPKGVMLTHKNMISCLASLKIGYGPAGAFGGTFLSYFPPAHVYELINMVASMYFARRTALYDGDVKMIFNEIQALKPSHLPLVPKLMNLFYGKVMEEIGSKRLKLFLLNTAMSRKKKLLRKGILQNDTVWDKYILKKIQNAFGGNIFASVTSSAPISKEVMIFFRSFLAGYMFEAYGQTEILGSTMTSPFETSGGFVGGPLPSNHVKLVDVPDLNYFSKNDEGEICIKGANVFKGYFLNPEATKESLDVDGWHHTGDIGRWLPNGALQIIDRKKHIFKLSQGEYIAPEKVENAYSRSALVQQVYVDGLSNKDYVVAIVCPDPPSFFNWCKERGFNMKENELIGSADVRAAFLKELHKFGKDCGLTSLEQAKNLKFYMEPLTLESDLITPTLKLKRNKARKHFEEQMQNMYEEGQILSSTES